MARYDLVCSAGHELIDITHSVSEAHPSCPICGAATATLWRSSPAVAGDEIDIQVRHGLCHEDGSPRRFRSKTELREAASQAGLSILGETPKPNAERSDREARQREK